MAFSYPEGVIRSFLVEWIGVVFGKVASGVRFLFPFVPGRGSFPWYEIAAIFDVRP